MPEKWKKSLDNSGAAGTVLIDLSKAYDRLPHDLLTTKLAAYDFSVNSLSLMYDYLNNRYRGGKTGSVRSHPHKIQVGILQGSVLRLMLFTIFIRYLFFFELAFKLCNFADENKIFTCGNDINEIIVYLSGRRSTQSTRMTRM